MPIEIEEERKLHLDVGPQTKDVPPGTRIIGGDPSAVRYSVQAVGEDGRLTVRIEDLITHEVTVAPMQVGTPVIIENPQPVLDPTSRPQ